MHQPKRRLSAVWFADIVGYTELSRRDEPAALDLVDLLQNLAREISTQYEGRVVKFIGDAVLTEFSSTDSAVRAAVAIQERYIAEAAARGQDSRLRVGVHLGEVTATTDGDLYGDGINTAARLQHEALPGQVIISEDVWRLLRQRPEFRFASLGAVELRGITTRVEIYDVLFGAKAALAPPGVVVQQVQPSATSLPPAPTPVALPAPARSKINPIWWAALAVPVIGVLAAIVIPRLTGDSARTITADSLTAPPVTTAVPAAVPETVVVVRAETTHAPAAAPPRAPAPAAVTAARAQTDSSNFADRARFRRDATASGIPPRELVAIRTFLDGFARSISTEPPRQAIATAFPTAPPMVLRGFQQLRETFGQGFTARIGRVDPRRVIGDTAEIRFAMQVQSPSRPLTPVLFDARLVRSPTGLRFIELRRLQPGRNP